MDLSSQKEKWAVWSVQARNFAKRENFPDAVARMKLVASSITDALAEVSDPTQKPRLEAHLARAEEQLAELQAQYDAWRAEIAARRQHTIDSAEEEMARPLPSEAD
jgi:plasmid maintenance system antidote protein VapI